MALIEDPPGSGLFYDSTITITEDPADSDLYLSSQAPIENPAGSGLFFFNIKNALGSAVSITAGTTISITTTAAISVDDLIVVRVVSDNTSSTGPTYSGTDSGGNIYTTQAHRVMHVGGVAQSGVAGAILVSKATNAVAAGETITVTLSASTPAKAVFAESYVAVDNILRSTAVTAAGTSATPTVTSGIVNSNDLVLGHIGVESWTAFGGDTDTLNGSWSAQTLLPNATSGTDTSRVEVAGQYKVPNVSGPQTFNATLAGSAEWIAMIIVLQASGPAVETDLQINIASTVTVTDRQGYLEIGQIDIDSAATFTVGVNRSSLMLPTNIRATFTSTDQYEETVRVVSIVATFTMFETFYRYLDYAQFAGCPTSWARFASGGAWQLDGPTTEYGGPLMHHCRLPWNHTGEHYCGCSASVAKPANEGRVAPPSETVDPIAPLTVVATP